MAKVQIEGVRDLQGALMELSSAARKGVLTRALRKAAAPLLASMKAFAPYDEGTLENSIIVEMDVESLAKKAGDRAYAAAMVQGFTRGTAGRAFRDAARPLKGQYSVSATIGPHRRAAHAHLVEYGTGPRYHKSGKYVGKMPPDPFVRPAWDRDGGSVAQGRIADELKAELDKAVMRARARAAKKAAG